MFSDVFRGLFDTELTSVIALSDFLLCVASALVVGLILAAFYMYGTRYTKSFVATLALLPAVVCVVIMMVNGNVGTGVAVAGAFSLVRFRSAPGSAKEIGAIFLAMGILSGFANSEHADAIIKQFMDGAKDMLSAAIVVGLAGGIIQILQDGHIIDPILHSLASLMGEAGKIVSLGVMYLIQTLINLIIPSGSAKAALTMPIMAPFSDVIGLSRQATVMAYQFGDGFTNMITPTSAVLMGALGIARIPYEIWVKWFWKILLLFIILGMVLLIPTVLFPLNGF